LKEKCFHFDDFIIIHFYYFYLPIFSCSSVTFIITHLMLCFKHNNNHILL
jgi:hypothetical protein